MSLPCCSSRSSFCACSKSIRRCSVGKRHFYVIDAQPGRTCLPFADHPDWRDGDGLARHAPSYGSGRYTLILPVKNAAIWPGRLKLANAIQEGRVEATPIEL